MGVDLGTRLAPPRLERRAREQAGARGESVPEYILSLLRGAYPERPPFRIFEVPVREDPPAAVRR